MIFFYGEGRLGNQVFQYQALSHIANQDEHIFAVGLEDLQQILDLFGPKVTVLTRNGILKRMIKYLFIPFLLRPLAKHLRLIRYVYEAQEGVPPHHGHSGNLCSRNGVFRGLTFVDGGYYHNASLWKSLFPADLFTINPDLRRAARNYLDSTFGLETRTSFVHVRRGDYQGYKTYGLTDLLLPLDYFRSALIELEQRVGKTHIVFLTDDPQWVEENFRDISDKAIPALDASLDFAIMTECRSAILSNSSFSLAAALMLDKPDLIIAPRFWFGFRVGEWFPPRIEVVHDRLLYLPVLPELTAP
jgi:hypothetical protein